MNASLSVTDLIRPISRIFKRFHLVIFVLLIAGGLAVAIFYLNLVIAKSLTEAPASASTRFDTTTIQRIDELKTRNDSPQSPELSGGRINPFVE